MVSAAFFLDLSAAQRMKNKAAITQNETIIPSLHCLLSFKEADLLKRRFTLDALLLNSFVYNSA